MLGGRLLAPALGVLALTSLVFTANNAGAAVVDWDFRGGCSVDCGLDGPDGNTRIFVGSDSSTTVTAQAWGRTGGSSNTLFRTGFLGHFGSGLGVTNRDEGSGGGSSHTLDNVNRLDVIAFSFSAIVEPISAFLRAFESR